MLRPELVLCLFERGHDIDTVVGNDRCLECEGPARSPAVPQLKESASHLPTSVRFLRSRQGIALRSLDRRASHLDSSVLQGALCVVVFGASVGVEMFERATSGDDGGVHVADYVLQGRHPCCRVFLRLTWRL